MEPPKQNQYCVPTLLIGEPGISPMFRCPHSISYLHVHVYNTINKIATHEFERHGGSRVGNTVLEISTPSGESITRIYASESYQQSLTKI